MKLVWVFCIAACCLAAPARAQQAVVPDLPDGFAVQTVCAGLTGATSMAVAPDGRIFVCEQTGALRVVRQDRLLREPFVTLDVDSQWERGLLGVAIDPQFDTNHFVYVLYVAREPYPHHRVSRFVATGDAAERGSEQVLFSGDDQRQFGGAKPAGHQGGGLHFGGDGKLYVGIGEQTAGAPAQRLDTLLGKMLRLNADGSIPDDNPLLQQTQGKYRAIWAYGLRNPFGFAFQPGSGRLLINDVGGSRWEEINDGQAGANYGWPESEGPSFNPRHRGPLHTYAEGSKQSISGGVFYTSSRPQFPESYRDKYLFADYMFGWIRVLDVQRPQRAAPFASGLPGPVDLKLDLDGSLLCLCRNAWVRDEKFRDHTGSLLRIFHIERSGRPAPRVASSVEEIVGVAGQRVELHVVAEAAGEVSYQWQRNGKPLAGATKPTLLLDKLKSSDHGAEFRCVVSNAHGAARSGPATVWLAPLREPARVGASKPGLLCRRYEGAWSGIPDFTDAKLISSATVPTIEAAPLPASAEHGIELRGLVRVAADGAYTFRLSTSGAAKLFVAGAEVAAVGPGSVQRDDRGVVGLKAGDHRLHLVYAHASAPPKLSVAWSGPGSAETALPAGRLFQEDTTVSAASRESSLPRQTAFTLNVPRRPGDLPPRLSQTGIFRSLATLEPERGVVPYEVNSPLWSDGALKRRWLVLRGDDRLGFSERDQWSFPAGTVLVKHFELGDAAAPQEQRTRLETRLLVVGRRGLGFGATYRWRHDQSDADLLADRVTEEVAFQAAGGPRKLAWTWPSRQDCLACHTLEAGFVLGVNSRQLHRADPRGDTDNQLLTWSRAGLLDGSLDAESIATLPRLAAVGDATAGLEHRVRSYLDANCAHCHRPGGVRAEFDARFVRPLDEQGLVGGKLVAADLGLARAKVVVPGERGRSMLYLRMARRQDVFNMPPLASHVADDEALETVGRWIDTLPRSPSRGTP